MKKLLIGLLVLGSFSAFSNCPSQKNKVSALEKEVVKADNSGAIHPDTGTVLRMAFFGITSLLNKGYMDCDQTQDKLDAIERIFEDSLGNK